MPFHAGGLAAGMEVLSSTKARLPRVAFRSVTLLAEPPTVRVPDRGPKGMASRSNSSRNRSATLPNGRLDHARGSRYVRISPSSPSRAS